MLVYLCERWWSRAGFSLGMCMRVAMDRAQGARAYFCSNYRSLSQVIAFFISMCNVKGSAAW